MIKFSILALFLGIYSFAGTTSVPVEFEIVDAEAFCKKSNCKTVDQTGEVVCDYRIFFEAKSFATIKKTKKEKGLSSTWFEKSPRKVCEAAELPEEGKGTGKIRVMLYQMDRSVLTKEF